MTPEQRYDEYRRKEDAAKRHIRGLDAKGLLRAAEDLLRWVDSLRAEFGQYYGVAKQRVLDYIRKLNDAIREGTKPFE